MLLYDPSSMSRDPQGEGATVREDDGDKSDGATSMSAPCVAQPVGTTARTTYANFGVSSCCDSTTDSPHLILHLRVYPKKKKARSSQHRATNARARSASATTTGPAYGMDLSPQQTYNELLTYSPQLAQEPMAYESTGTDSAPCALSGETKLRAEALTGTPEPLTRGDPPVSGGAEATETPPSEPTDVFRHALRAHEVDERGARKSVGDGRARAAYEVFHPLKAAQVHGPPLASAPLPVLTSAPEEAHDISSSDNAWTTHTTTSPRRRDDPTHETHCCWWCTLAFDWQAYTMPLRYEGRTQTYRTYGAFCSPECAAAYMFDNDGKFGDTLKQYEMLHRMVHKHVQNRRVRIKLAPPRETLKKFGGVYDEDAYRSLLTNYRTDVRVVMPPVQPVQTTIEECVVNYNTPVKKYVPIDNARVELATNELRLKRKKKHSSENTLETFMRLRIS